jgi:hypothetical protein
MPWTAHLDTDHLRALYASMIDVLRRPEREQRRLLDDLATVADNQFGGEVDLPFVTALYTGCRP